MSTDIRDECLLWTAEKFKKLRLMMEQQLTVNAGGKKVAQTFQLRLNRAYIGDDDDSDTESSEVSLIVHPDYDDELVSLICIYSEGHSANAMVTLVHGVCFRVGWANLGRVKRFGMTHHQSASSSYIQCLYHPRNILS